MAFSLFKRIGYIIWENNTVRLQIIKVVAINEFNQGLSSKNYGMILLFLFA